MLNDSQQLAVDHNAQYLQIVAGPGTGKTHTLASRIARVVFSGETEPERILAVTYTNQAATELRERLILLLGEEIGSKVQTFTYHGLCHHLVVAFPHKSGLPAGEWSVADEWDQQLLTRGAGMTLKRIRTIKAHIGDGVEVDSLEKRSIAPYDQRLRSMKLLDYDDLLILGNKVVNSLEPSDLDVDHIFADEFQDSTISQWQILETLAKRRPKLKITVVGDPNQEIYRFLTGWQTDAFTSMRKSFPSSEQVVLNVNYRSTQEIADLTAEIVKEKPAMSLTGGKHELPLVKTTENEGSDSKLVLEIVKELLADFKPEDIAILARTNAQIGCYQAELDRNGISTRTSIDKRVFKTPYVRAIYALYKYALSPNNVYLGYLISNPATDVVTSHHLKKMLDAADPLIDQLKAITKTSAHRKKVIASFLASFEYTIEQLRTVESTTRLFDLTLTFMDDVIEAINGTGSSGKDKQFGPTREQLTEKYHEQCREFFRWIEAHVTQLGRTDEPLLAQIVNAIKSPILKGDDAVTIQTVHSAKGLEWPAVIIPSANSETFPLQMNFSSFKTDLESEKKILYVAASRAKERLVFTYGEGELSPFLSGCKSLQFDKNAMVTKKSHSVQDQWPRVFAMPPLVKQISLPPLKLNSWRALHTLARVKR